ncbi:glucosaminidase domain-containing protein [Pseudoalteromonas sp. SSDWG2]|uniref:glucosaminidase domain-containing protein n=1 Tax=Pseudoalteromonas sp. SSDWG2 TaxID=3139391 RepID=UPI003BA8CF86
MIKKLTLLILICLSLTALVYPFIWGDKQPVVSTQDVPKIKKKAIVVEKPLHNVTLPDFANIADVKQKKSAFFDFIRVPVERANKRVKAQRATLEIAAMMLDEEQALSESQLEDITEIFSLYRMEDEEVSALSVAQALRRVDLIPKELVMMQAANESAWGTSRFARIGLNFFGQWCFSEGCGMVPKRRNDGAKHEVAVYQSVQEAVDAYFYNINTHNAYRELRDIRASLREQQKPLAAKDLAYGLMSYSERGEEYIEELHAMIDHNEAYFDE